MNGFTEHHSRRGLVSNQDRNVEGWGHRAPFASTVCCGRPECVERAIAAVAAQTNSTAFYQPDAEVSA